MAHWINKRTKLLLFLFLTLLTTSLFAGGQGEEDTTVYTMEDAEILIEQKDYNQAIEILISLSKQDPELFERAQQKIKEIRDIRDSYNDTYDNLIFVLFEEEDYEQALELIKELEGLDSNPNDATRTAIRDARMSAELIYYRKIFNQIMDQALVFLEDKKYYQATKLYETGFELFRQTFDENPYGPLIKDPVYRAFDELTQSLAFVEDDWENFLFDQEEGDALALGQNSPYNRLIDNIEVLTEHRNHIYRISLVYERQNQLVVEGNDGVEDFYLSFMNKLLAGRLASGEWEGITVALDYYIEQSQDLAQGILEGQTREAMEKALTFYSQGNLNQVQNELSTASTLAEKLNGLYDQTRQRVFLEPSREIDRLGTRIVGKYYNGYWESRNLGSQIDTMAALVTSEAELDRLAGLFPTADREEYNDLREFTLGTLGTFSPQMNNLQSSKASVEFDPLLTDKSLVTLNRIIDNSQALVQRGRVFEGDLVVAMADWDIRAPEAILDDFETRLSLDMEYISGRGQEDLELPRYPQRALSDIALLNNQVRALIQEGTLYKETYSDEQDTIYDGILLTTYIERITNLIARSNGMIQELTDLKEDGDNFVYLAQKDFNAGEFRFSQAERELSNGNYQLARGELDKARDLYVSALNYDEDTISRDDLDARIASLLNRIIDEENKEVIRDVRILINQGKDLYFQGLYAQSEAKLIQAENKWYTTNTDVNSELAYWMSLVRTALSVESGRFLEESNPLYNEISQLLNLAWKKYEEGEAYLAESMKIEGLMALNRGDEFLNQVIILMPLNQNASVLKLRIERARDPDAFSIIFAEKYRNALSKKEFQEEQAYIELKDLAELIPNYGRIQDEILDLEYRLGIKVRPPDPAKLRESTRLTRLAQAIYESGDITRFEEAIAQCTEAILLNPNNSAASELKDDLGIYVGGSTPPVSTRLRDGYSKAEEKYISGDNLGAYQLVQDLWNDPDNRSYLPLRELKKKLEVLLGL